MKPIVLIPIAAVLLIAGCASGRDHHEGPQTASTDIASPGPDGRVLAHATLTQVTGGVRVYIQAAGLQPGTYAAHIHQHGSCGGEAFAGAGPHWNPTGREHGAQNPNGTHFGDLPNLIVSANGEGTIGFVVRGASLTGPVNAVLDADGAAVVIHAQPDDYRTDPSGNSGARIACGELAPVAWGQQSAPPAAAEDHSAH